MDNLDAIQKLLQQAAILTPLVTGLTQVAKPFLTEKRYTKVTALLLGIASALLIIDFTVVAGVVGAFIGLAATGLYEQIKR